MTIDSAVQLVNANTDHVKATETWHEVAVKIKDYCSKDHVLNGGMYQPLPVDLLNDGTIVMEVAGSQVACRFKSRLQGGVLLFGYLLDKPGRNPKFKVTKKIYLDHQGNLLQKKGGEPGPHLLLGEEFYKEVFFAECMIVLNAINWKL